MSEVTRILSAIDQGDAHAAAQLLPLVNEELRKLAVQRLAQEKPGQTLQATALVHEAYLRLVDVGEAQDWNSRGHFFAAAAEAMRRILVDQARSKQADKHGGGRPRVDLPDDLAAPDAHPADLVALDEALTQLERHDPAAARLVTLRYFAGLSLRGEVESLLEASRRAGRFLEPSAPARGATVDLPPSAERPGTVIGPYTLLQQIGEGGMGTVFMAEQTEPVRRKVALKVIKAGMDSRQVIARFEAERQALAMMDHVNIARVLDAGATDSGLPYFVMELVHGVPITKYCDDNHLTPRERLELFVPVCQAIQHAHQKGIIHRDIKPSNVMVTLYDGKPVPKMIDFGVAKATEQKLTEKTLFTQYGTIMGTLEYMSPEQAEMSALGTDTRSDIFSLGVLLYELLA